MPDIPWEQEGPSLTKSDIRDFEQATGVRLHADHATFLMRQNGGCPSPSHFAWSTSNGSIDWTWIDDVLCIAVPTGAGRSVAQSLQSELGMPSYVLSKEYVPFAVGGGGGDLVVVTIAGRDAGALYIAADGRGSGGPLRLERIAGSIDEFLESLQDDPGDEAYDRCESSDSSWPGVPEVPVPPHRLAGCAPEFIKPQRERVADSDWGRFSDVGPPLSTQRVTAACRRLGCSLPVELRRFLTQCNGGRPERDVLPLPVETEPTGQPVCLLSYLYGLDPTADYRDLEAWDRTLRKRLPKGWLAVGCTVEEDQLVICVQGKRLGEVCHWDAFSASRAMSKCLTHVAPSFNAFLGMLRTAEQHGP
jgi:hypothetical protein